MTSHREKHTEGDRIDAILAGKQVWVKIGGKWFKHGEPFGLWINAMDSARQRIAEGYTVAVAREGERPEDGVQQEQIEKVADYP